MPNTYNAHSQAVGGAELRGWEYRKFADVAAMNLVTGRPGEICTVTATGDNYYWDNVAAAWQRFRQTSHVYPFLKTTAGVVNAAVTADLTAGRLVLGDAIQTAAYYEGSDIGGCTYVVRAAATGTDNAGAFINAGTFQLQAAFDGTICASQFGVFADGATDDTVAFQRAIDWSASVGARLTLPGGRIISVTRKQANSCLFLRSGCNISGPRSAVVQVAAGATDATGWLRVFASPAGGVSNVTLAGFSIDGNRDNLGVLLNDEQHHGVFLANSSHMRFDSLRVDNCEGDGIFLYLNTVHGEVTNCSMTNNRRVGINVHGLYQGLVDGNYVIGDSTTPWNAEVGIKIELDNTDAGLTLGYVTITNNVVRTITGISITRNAAVQIPGILIAGNRLEAFIDGALNHGILTSQTTNLTIANNYVTGYGRAIRLGASDLDFNVSNNTCTGPTIADPIDGLILLGGTSDTVPVSGGIVSGNRVSGFRGISLRPSGGGAGQGTISIVGNRVDVEQEALYVLDASNLVIADNYFRSTAGHASAWIRSILSSPTDLLVTGNRFVGGTLRNLLVDATVSGLYLKENFFSGSPLRVSGTPTAPYVRRDADNTGDTTRATVTVTGNGVTTTHTVTHNLGLTTPFIPTSVTILHPNGSLMPPGAVTVAGLAANSFTITFASAPLATETYTVRVGA